MRDCCPSRKGFGLEERHGIDDNDNSGGIFPNKFPYGRPPERNREPQNAGAQLGPLLGVAVQEQLRTTPDDQNAVFTGICRTIGRLGGS